MPLLEMISYPFMQRALISGVLLGVLLAYLGIFVTLRKMAFFGDGIAHSSLAGIAVAVLAGWAPLPVALALALSIALLIFWLERSTRLPTDTLIGIFFTASMALGVLLMSFSSGYQPELVSFLFGSILAIQNTDLIITALVGGAIVAWLGLSFRSLTYMSLAEDNAAVAGVNIRLHTAALYAALALATVLGVKILGVVLVSALLILPAATSRLLTRSFRSYTIGSLILAEVMIIGGLLFSFRYDLPSGATIVLIGTTLFFLAAIARRLAR
ncbi:MAG: metal ABC transporter permease [Patescibacteria group bacterium]